MVTIMTPRGRSPLEVRYEMRIAEQKERNITPTKCLKMSEEAYRRHGINGSLDGRHISVKEECQTTPYNQGGRLKFFKDGKFILELERAQDGEKVSWVSVPRKTYWPPQGNAISTTTYKQESSTSLSVSDDNSSLQSSPWQRDHSWKQTIPRKNLSKEMTFYYWCPKKLSSKKPRFRHRISSFDRNTSLNGNNKQTETMCNNRKVTCKPRVRSLLTVVQILSDRITSNVILRSDTVVSPRKRFLREMEKDKLLLDDACQKRSRNKVQSVHISSTSVLASRPSISKGCSPPVQANGANTSEEARQHKNCSYSITSLLADDRNTSAQCSPEKSPSQFSPVPQIQYRSPSSEDPWYSESVDRLRSIELSQVDKRTLSTYPAYHYMSPYMYSYSVPSYYPANMYSRNYMVPPVYQVTPLPAVHLRNDTPSCSWTSESRSVKEECKEDNLPDMPLNLSKHAS